MLQQDFILIKNVSEENASTILSNLATLYAESGFTNGIELARNEALPGTLLVTFQNPPDFERFAFFVNYVHYPEGVELFNHEVKGFYKVKQHESEIKFKPEDWLQLFVSKNDNDFDNVSIVTESNEAFLFDFGGKTKNLSFAEQQYELPAIEKTEFSLVKVFNP